MTRKWTPAPWQTSCKRTMCDVQYDYCIKQVYNFYNESLTEDDCLHERDRKCRGWTQFDTVCVDGVPAVRMNGLEGLVLGAQPLELYRRWIDRHLNASRS